MFPHFHLCLDDAAGSTQWEEPDEVTAARAPPPQPSSPPSIPAFSSPPLPTQLSTPQSPAIPKFSSLQPPAIPKVRASMLFSAPPLPAASTPFTSPPAPLSQTSHTSNSPPDNSQFSSVMPDSTPATVPVQSDLINQFDQLPPISPVLAQGRSRVALEISGNLMKKKIKTPKGPVSRKLEKRFFVLRNKELIYYESAKATEVLFQLNLLFFLQCTLACQ